MITNIQPKKVYECDFTSNFVYPDCTYVSYKGKNFIYVEEVTPETRRLVIRNRVSEVKNPRRSTVDDLIIQLGNCLFPISFLLDADGNVLEIENFEEVRNRRVTKSKELASQYPTTEFKKYLEISMMNFEDEPTLRKKLSYDTFLQVIVPALHRSPFFRFHIENFPRKMIRTSFHLKEEKVEPDHVVYHVAPMFPSFDGGREEGEAELYEKDGLFYGFKGMFSVIDSEGNRTQKGIVIQMKEE